MELLYHTESLKVSYDPESRILHCHWKGKQTTEAVKRAGAAILKIVQERKIKKVLNDNATVIGSWQDAAEWAAREWFPEMISAGLQYFAWVLPTNAFAELSVRVAMSGVEDVVTTFGDKEKAYQWLVAQAG